MQKACFMSSIIMSRYLDESLHCSESVSGIECIDVCCNQNANKHTISTSHFIRRYDKLRLLSHHLIRFVSQQSSYNLKWMSELFQTNNSWWYSNRLHIHQIRSFQDMCVIVKQWKWDAWKFLNHLQLSNFFINMTKSIFSFNSRKNPVKQLSQKQNAQRVIIEENYTIL